ncbi:hypothetical protein SUDANB120_04435 [Streptomyces sp. enrichment culture]|uniref:Uncharacterized protein n=1 Tax=Streptomyces toxytricini TaxID=67369 RepID=A0ABW8EAH9_STRT5|nr:MULTISPECIES: hypothetical protein [Streptomyces]MBD3580090.1 hypothetical protein [Streptomyces sp. KD18]GGS96141.1 hypothetical protein GCM10010286_21270 [Streptomyces toxytricini]
MFEYEMAALRRADLIREADDYRRAREAEAARRASSRRREPESGVRGQRGRFARAA